MSYRKTHRWLGLATAGLLAVALVGCGGSDGAAGPQGPAGPAGTAGTPGTPGSSGTPGTSSAGSVNLAAITSEAWASANFKAEISKVTVSSPPVVEFSVTDATGAPVVGFEKLASKSATATIASYPNFGFTIAKLMPRTDSKPSSWVNYVVTSVSTTTGAVSAARPSTDNIGKLEAVADKPGSYKYTFYRDVPAVKAQIDGMTFSGNNRKDDLGDLTWQPNLPHRLVIQIAGAAPGTGSNTPTGTQVTPTVNLENALNVVYDFIPATGKVLTSAELTREDVNIDSCNVCHGKLALHGGSARVETRYCVACHTDQRAYGRAMATSTLGMFPALTETKSVNAATGITSYRYSPDTYVADGEVSGNFTTLIHKIHNGTSLVKENYHYAGLAFNNKGFSKLGGGQRMCTTCHDSSIAATADNHKKLPSRQACGACHDGINWQTGGGSTLADKAAVVKPGDMLKTSGHIGRAQADDAQCALCHTPDYIKIDHRMENLTKNNTYILPGLASFTYDIKDVSVNAGNDLIIEFGIKQRVAPSTTETLITLVPPAASVPASLAGFSGGPSFLLAFAVSQDGVAMPVDYTNTGAKLAQPRGVSIANLLNTNNAANGNIVPSTTTTGYYKATIRGTGAWAFPLGAKLRTVALQGYYTQLNAPTNLQGGVGSVGRHAISVIKTVTGDTARRVVVDNAKCAGCHEWFEGHGGNRVYETQVCAMCHNPGLPTSGRGISDATLLAYNFSIKDNKLLTEWGFNKTLSNAALQFPVTSNNLKDMIHGIHAGRDRVMPFQDARDRTPAAITLLDLRRMDFPGKLGNCETCHVTTASNTQKSYNFVPANTLMSTYESVDAAYAAGMAGGTATTAMAKTALNTLNSGDMVVTPFTASCVSCHDNAAAKAHVSLNGGYVNVSRATALAAGGASAESCAVCHGPTREFDAAKVHK